MKRLLWQKYLKIGLMIEDNFRNTLIIISTVIIGAIFVHGLWTIRKNKNPYKLKTKKDLIKPTARDFDRGGFDQAIGFVKQCESSGRMKLQTRCHGTSSPRLLEG